MTTYKVELTEKELEGLAENRAKRQIGWKKLLILQLPSLVVLGLMCWAVSNVERTPAQIGIIVVGLLLMILLQWIPGHYTQKYIKPMITELKKG